MSNFVDSVQYSDGAATTSAETPALTISGANRAVWAHVATQALGPEVPSSVKVGGVSGTNMTQQGSSISQGFLLASTWQLIGPAAGSSTVYAAWTNAQDDRTVLADSWDTVDPADPRGTLQTNTNASASSSSINVTTTAGQNVRDSISISADAAITPGAGQTTMETSSGVTGFDAACSSRETATGATTTMSHTWGPGAGVAHFAFAIHDAASGAPFTVTQVGQIAMLGTLGIQAGVAVVAEITLAQVGRIALQGTLGISAELQVLRRVWRVPTNATPGTPVFVMIMSGTGPYAIVTQGSTVVQPDGHAEIAASGSLGTKAFAFVHNFDGDTNTTSIYGGPGIGSIVDVT